MVTSGVVTTSNNSIGSQTATGSLVYNTTTTTSTDIYGIYNAGSDALTVSSNQIGGLTITNAGASGTFIVYGIRGSASSAVSWTVTSNIVGGTIASSIQCSSSSTLAQLIGIYNSAPAGVLTSNTIRNLTINGGTGTTTSASLIGISSAASSANQTISQNTIHNLSNSNTTLATTVTGIQFTGSTSNTVERNKIYALTNASSSATAIINGINISGGTTTYQNNMIALGAGMSNSPVISGISEPLGTDNFIHNSIYIGGTATSGSAASYAFNSTQTVVARIIRDNIFVNNRGNSGATAKHYIIRVGGTTPLPVTGLTSNNNIYFANGAGAVFGNFNAADVATLAAWKTAVGQDANSYQSDPQYLGATAATPDLHINAAISTVAESNGADIGVTNDFDGQTRSGFTPVDIGADAGNFTGVDLTGPIITYTPLNNTCTLTGVTLTATITDVSGVPTSGAGLPKLYWKVNSGSYTALTAAFVSGNTYSFTFGAGSVGNTISYYIVAQDAAATPNVSCSPAAGAAGFTAGPPAVSTTPTTPSAFNLQNSLSGTYNVGVGKTYTTISAAIAAYNTSCLSGPVVFSLSDAAYTEAAAMIINANSFASAVNTLTIKPTQANTTIAVTGGSASAIFILNGADYVTIDGSTGSTANTVCPLSAASRNLTITNSNAGTTSAVVWLQTNGADAATNNIIRNCNLVGNSNTTTLFAVGAGSSTISTSSLGAGNNNNAYVNNNISKTQYGIYSQGTSAASKNTGTVINQNFINTVSPNNVGVGGILAGFENSITISGNTISEINGTSDRFGISAGFGTSFSGSTLVAAEVTNASITNNIIGNIIGTGTNSSLGIALGAAASGTSLIANNMVYGITHNSTTTDIAAGIAIGGGAGSVTNIYHNTVSMQGAITGVTAANSTSACLAVTATSAPVLDIRNNIFSNTQSNNSGASMRFTAIALGYTSATGNYSGLTSNNNDLYAAGSLGTYTAGITGGITGTNRVSLANWNTETGRDAAPASKNVLPVFLSSTNLHLDNTNSSNASNLDGSAATGTGVTADIDCATRNGSTPDMGADEITTPNCTGATGGTASGSIAFCGSGTPTISATGYSTGTTTTYQWYASTVLADYPNAGAAVSGQANPAALTTGIVSATTYYWLRVTCVAASAIGNSTMVTVTVNPIPALTTVSGAGTFCTSTTITAANGADGTMYFQGIISGGTNISFPSASQTITTSNTYYFRAQSAAGCWGPEGSTTVVIETSPVITPGNATLCQNGTGSMTATSTCFSAGSIEWYTAAAGGSSIGAGSPFNPVGVAGSGLTNTATAGTTVYYAACSNVPVCRVAVNFLIKSNYNIVASAGSGGIISSSGNTKLSCDGTASKTYTITPNACYSVADVLVDGVSQGAISSYTFSNVSANHTIAASFVLKTYVITATAGANGTVTPATGPVSCGSNATYTITASPGYSISNVDVDAVSQGAISSYTFSNVQAVHTISATFVINCVNAGITSATAAPAGPLCSGQTTTLSANGVVGTNALVTWYTGTGATGANLGTGTSLPNRGPGTYYAYVTGNCGTPAEASITISSTGNTFSGSGNWTDNARWSCGTAPSINDVITIASGAIVTLNTNFTVAGNLSMAATSKLIVSPTSSLTVSGSADFAGQPVIFKSDNTGTASLGQVTGTLTGATNVTVERYIPQNANKAWRLLASNTVGQTIKQAWQENQTGYNSNANPGFGTMIPGSGGSLAAVQANGFDTLSLGKSLFKYNPLTDNMDPVANTNNTQLSSETGYFIFIRGNRSPNQFGSGAAQSSTVLRSTGSIYIGNQPAVNVPAGQYALIRNPYPSRLDMRQIARTGGLVDAYQVWDPKLAGAFAVGAYQTFTKNSSTGDYEVSPGGGSYGANGSVYNYIESGAAFFAQATGSSGTVQVLESSKASGSQVVFRPTAPLSVSSRLLFNVYANNVGSTDVVDGGFVDFDDAYSNAVDASDVRKSTNFGENFGILRNNTELVVERRKSVSANDTIFFKMYQLRQMSYRIDLETTGFDPLLTTAVLQDKFTGTNTTIDLSGPAASYTFTVNGTAGSFATDRFRLVLAASANVFSGTGNWTDNARWSHGAPPASGEVVTIAADANATLNSNFTVGGSLTMNATSTLTVDPARTLAVGTGGTVNFNGQSVTFKSDITGTASLGQMLGTLNGATNVTVERYIPNNGFRSWRLLSVPTFSSGQTIRQAWQEGVANPLPLQNNLAGYGTQITGAGINAAASQAAGFDNAGTTSSLLSWNGTGWTGAASTNTAIAAQKPGSCMYVAKEARALAVQ
ncbi:MAG: hypothetical protein IPP72_14085 [Chitinophagaceae bacterium]|nr:hypothetical protein [Chitinophagaceae bacterium]